MDLEERRKAYVPPEADYVHKIGICGTRVSCERESCELYDQKEQSDVSLLCVDCSEKTQEDVSVQVER